MNLGKGASTITFMYNDALEESFARLDCIKLTYVGASEDDINGDGTVDICDALVLIKNILNGNAEKGDMNGDGRISLLDVLQLLKTIVK